MIKKDLDWDIFKEATAYSESIVNDIIRGLNDPTYVISGESKTVYEELDRFKWFEDKPLSDMCNKSFYIKLISMQQYRHLMWKLSHKGKINKKELSKWEKVMGVVK